MNAKLREKAKNDFEKEFFKQMIYAVFGKIMQNVRKYRDIKLVTTERRKKYLVSEPNWHNTKSLIENLLGIEMRKTQILMNKRVYLTLSTLDLSKTAMHEFWYGYVKPKYGGDAKICYMETDGFNDYVKTEDIYKNIAENAKTKFGTSNFVLGRPLSKWKNRKVILKYELGGVSWKILLD